jgi:hypothetical protein
MWEPDRGQLERLRRAIDDDATGGELTAIADGLAADGVAIYGAELKTRRAVRQGPPRIDLLRRKRLAAMVTHTPGRAPDPGGARPGRRGLRTVAPLQAWLERHVGPPDAVDRDADRGAGRAEQPRLEWASSVVISPTELFASPNSMDVFGLTNSGLSIPANPDAIERLRTMTDCESSTLRIGMP